MSARVGLRSVKCSQLPPVSQSKSAYTRAGCSGTSTHRGHRPPPHQAVSCRRDLTAPAAPTGELSPGRVTPHGLRRARGQRRRHWVTICCAAPLLSTAVQTAAQLPDWRTRWNVMGTVRAARARRAHRWTAADEAGGTDAHSHGWRL